MANAYFAHQFVLDTPHADTLLKDTLLRAAGESVPRELRIASIRWIGAALQGDQVVITREAGGVLWESEAEVVSWCEMDTTPRRWDGDWKLTTLDSGRLYITLWTQQQY